jgi:UDP-3-O-[3-hydroxymyristoyl] glucosamine N-acyltransferase
MDSWSDAENWLRSDSMIYEFCHHGKIIDSSYSEWDMYELIINKLKSIPTYISDNACIDPTATISGSVIIEDGAEILPNTIIKGPCYLGKNVVVGNFTFIRPFSFISNEALIGNHSYCNEAVIGPKSRASHFVGCSRSILMRNVTLSSFVLTATLRADYMPIMSENGNLIKKRGCVIGENTYLAPHTTVSPGVKIGKNCFIGSYINITKDIADKRFLKADINILDRENDIKVGERNFQSIIEKEY